MGRLRLAWTLDLDVSSAQATPLAVEGMIYVAAGYSIVYAVDAKTGKSLWRFDPQVLLVAGKKLRAGAGVRGLAYSKGRLFVGTHDGRLIALDAKKGTALWSTPTLEANDGTFISGAPRVFNDKVAIGFGDSGAVHGAVGVYDAATGKRVWSWETGAVAARCGTPSPTTPKSTDCMSAPATRAAQTPRAIDSHVPSSR